MNNLVKSQYLHIQSKYRTNGETHSFDIEVPNRYIECEDDELMAITLVNFNFFQDWYNITTENNTFTLTKVSDSSAMMVVLPTGNYPIKTLVSTINTIWGSKICSWNKVKNLLYFTFDEPYTLTFDNASYEVLGFENTAYTGSVFSSVNVLNPMAHLQNIVVRINGLMPYKCYNLENTGNNLTISNILMSIPFDNTPFDMFSYTNDNNEFRMYFHDKRVMRFTISLTDYEGNPLTFIPDWTATFKIETFMEEEEDEQLQVLKKMLEYTKMSFLSKHLK